MNIGPLSISNLPAVKFDGVWRVLGCIRSDDKHDFVNFGDAIKSAATFELREIDLSPFNNRILDQGSTSACVGHGCASGMEIGWCQAGRPVQYFNPFYIYGWINGGRDGGAMISDALMELKTRGVCKAESLPPGVMFSNQFPAAAIEEAKRFRIAQAYKCRTFDEICQAINLGFVVPLGILVGQNFGNLDNEGIAPLPNGGGGGHCILGCGLKRSQRYGWVIKIKNSWSMRYGLNGYAYIRKEHFQSMSPDAFAVQALFDDPQDNTPVDEIPIVTN